MAMSKERLAEIKEMLADHRARCGRPGAVPCCSAHPVADVVDELVDEIRAQAVASEQGRQRAEAERDTASAWRQYLTDETDVRWLEDLVRECAQHVVTKTDYQVPSDAQRRIPDEIASLIHAGAVPRISARVIDLACVALEPLKRERDNIRADRDRLAEQERYLQETTDAAMSGWKKAEAEQDRLAERLDNAETRIYQAFAEANERGMSLDALTTHQLTTFVMQALSDREPAEEVDRG